MMSSHFNQKLLRGFLVILLFSRYFSAMGQKPDAFISQHLLDSLIINYHISLQDFPLVFPDEKDQYFIEVRIENISESESVIKIGIESNHGSIIRKRKSILKAYEINNIGCFVSFEKLTGYFKPDLEVLDSLLARRWPNYYLKNNEQLVEYTRIGSTIYWRIFIKEGEIVKKEVFNELKQKPPGLFRKIYLRIHHSKPKHPLKRKPNEVIKYPIGKL